MRHLVLFRPGALTITPGSNPPPPPPSPPPLQWSNVVWTNYLLELLLNYILPSEARDTWTGWESEPDQFGISTTSPGNILLHRPQSSPGMDYWKLFWTCCRYYYKNCNESRWVTMYIRCHCWLTLRWEWSFAPGESIAYIHDVSVPKNALVGYLIDTAAMASFAICDKRSQRHLWCNLIESKAPDFHSSAEKH